MKDFLNFDIQSRQEGSSVRHTLRHKKRDNLHVSFLTTGNTKPEHIAALFRDIMKAWTMKYMKVTRRSLSPKQKAYYDAVVWFHKEEGRAPSYEEQCDLMSWRSKGTAHYFAKRLISMGWFWTDEDGRIIPVDIAAPDMTE